MDPRAELLFQTARKNSPGSKGGGKRAKSAASFHGSFTLGSRSVAHFLQAAHLAIGQRALLRSRTPNPFPRRSRPRRSQEPLPENHDCQSPFAGSHFRSPIRRQNKMWETILPAPAKLCPRRHPSCARPRGDAARCQVAVPRPSPGAPPAPARLCAPMCKKAGTGPGSASQNDISIIPLSVSEAS